MSSIEFDNYRDNYWHVAVYQELGHQIRDARKAHGMTQADVALAIGVSPPTISTFERGGRVIQGHYLIRLAQLLGLRLDLDPLEQLSPEAGRRAALVRELHRVMEELEDDDLELGLKLLSRLEQA